MPSKFLLDTDTWIEFFHNRHGIQEKLSTLDFSRIFISEITIAEFYYGALHSDNVEKHMNEVVELQRAFTILPISNCLMDYVEIRNELSKIGMPSASFDILIAATSRVNNCTLVTHNVKHFIQVSNLSVVDWFNN